MGGKHKHAQRTKNNARPSSSGRSAELLGSSIPPFVGFTTIKESGVVPGFSLTTDDIDSSMDSNFQLVLKKMNKKDSTTKLKALQEFSELVKTADVEVMKAVLPFWPRLYCGLATDIDHKVREATHLAHQQVVLKSKRNLAPYLKQFAGSWFTSQYDTYAPAASAATKSFQDTFPKNKIQEAIVYCQEEILTYICDNLTVHTPQTLSNPKVTTTEDAEAKYQRVVVSSLHGYALYLQQLSTEQIEKQADANLKIISDAKFRKLVKHKAPAIKSAWFCVVTSLCQKFPQFLETEVAHVVGSVFSNLDENDPGVISSMWEALLSILSTIKDWCAYVNIEKLVLPKLWKLLREGGYGNASVIFPNLLPLISQLPETSDSNSTFCLFFDNMFKGMKHQNAISSRKESLAIATAYIECLRYVLMKNQADIGFCEKLIRIHLLPVIEWNITDTQISCKGFFNQVAKVIQYWSKNANNPSFPNYSKYLQYFWNNLNSLFQGLLLNLELNYDKSLLTQFSSRQIDLLVSLKHAAPNKQVKVSFSTEKITETSSNDDDNLLLIDKSYTESLNNIVYNTCVSYVKFINEKRNKELIDYLVCLIQDFNSESFVYRLNNEFGGGGVKESLINIYRTLLDKWLNDPLVCSKSVIDLIFLIFKHLRSEEKLEILNGFFKLRNEECFGWCVAQALSHPHNEDETVCAWLQNDEISKFLLEIVEKEITDTCTPELSLILKRTFTEKPNGELYITGTAITSIIKKIIKPLLHPNDYPVTLDTCASYAAFLSTIIYTTNNKLSFGDDLLLALFSLSCQFDVDSDSLSKDTIWEVTTAWQDTISILATEMSWEEVRELTLKCAQLVNEAALNHKIDSDIQQIIEVIVSFVKCFKGNPLRISDVLHLLLNCNDLPAWTAMLNYVCVSAEYVVGNFCSPFSPLKLDEIDLNVSHIVNFCTWIDLMACVLTTPWIKDEEDDEDETEEKEEVQFVIHKVTVSDINDLLMYIFDFFTLASSFIQHYSCTKHSERVSTKLSSVHKNMRFLTTIINEGDLQMIENKLQSNIFSDNWLSIKTYYLYCSEIVSKDLCNEFNSLQKACDSKNLSLASLHLTQIFAKHVQFEQVCDRSSTVEYLIVLRQLLQCEELDIPIAEAFSKIVTIKEERKSLYFYESKILNIIQWEDVELIIECMRMYSNLLRYKSTTVTSYQRDAMLLSLVTWSANIANSKINFDKLQTKALIFALANLLVAFNECMKTCDKPNVVNEWKDVFSQGIHKDLVDIWMYISGFYFDSLEDVFICDLPFLQEFGKTLLYLDHTYLFVNKHPKLPKWSTLLKRSCALLIHPSYVLQLWGYYMLKALLPGLIEVDSTAVTTHKPHEKGLIFEQFKETLHNIQDIVESILQELKLCEESCRIEPYTDSYTYMSAYLLMWDILLTLCEYSSTELRYQYADWLKNANYLHNLLDNIYKLMPAEVLHYSIGETRQFSELFSTKCSINLNDACTSARIEHMACWIYFLTLLQLPALVRQWWSENEPRVSQIVEKVTAVFVSPQLCNKELADITKNETKFKNMVVKVHPGVREVVATYTIDEAQMELVINLKNNYPLTSPDVQCSRQIGGTSHRPWLMQLKMCLLHQNGRIWDGISIWNHNLDKKFDGVEECYICFAVLHQGTYQLPKLSCHTCRKKFHSACLYKWFSTSNKSTCPICRNLF